ncbi:MAG: hypothetical protein N2C14_34050, partial [Planctomycetales bacterium]
SLVALLDAPPVESEKASVFVVVGASGEKEYAEVFAASAAGWEKAAVAGDAALTKIGQDRPGEKPDRDLLRAALESESKTQGGPLWLAFIGHGTHDGKTAKFNLRGPDVSGAQLAEWLQPFQRPVVVVNCASSSGPFLNRLAGPRRVVVTATKSGHEVNYARFGKFFAETLADPAADLDKDGQASLLETYLIASRRVQDFYESEGRLATEQALLDDNGDGLGTPASWFIGLRAAKKAKGGAKTDGARAHQLHLVPSEFERRIPADLRVLRNQWEQDVADLRDQKSQHAEDDYYALLEPLLVKLARLHQRIDQAVKTP